MTRLKSFKAWGSGLAAMEKLKSALCCVLASAAWATLSGNRASPETASADAPSHCLTELPATDFALDFMLETRV